MQAVELKLARWRRLYDDLGQAQLRLREAKVLCPGQSPLMAELEAQVDRLEQDSNRALDAVHDALAERNAQVAAQNF